MWFFSVDVVYDAADLPPCDTDTLQCLQVACDGSDGLASKWSHMELRLLFAIVEYTKHTDMYSMSSVSPLYIQCCVNYSQAGANSLMANTIGAVCVKQEYLEYRTMLSDV